MPERRYVTYSRTVRAMIILALATLTSGAAAQEPTSLLEWLVGTWQAEFLPHGDERAAPTMSFEWANGKSYLRMVGTQPAEDGRLVPEHETMFLWNPIAGRYEFTGVYAGAGTKMFESGYVEVIEDGALRLHMAIDYAAGETLPFSDGAVAGPGGHTLEFQRTLYRDGDKGLRGTFFIKRGGVWENPHPQLGLDSYPWSRVGTSAASEANGVPAWVREHLAELTRDGGRWIASNAAYAQAGDPADAYGIEWSWTLGQQGVRGRLFGMRDGVEVGTYWEFRSFWHPGERRLVAMQFGSDGTFGSGTIVDRGDGLSELEQTFLAPNGAQSRTLHRSTMDGNIQTSSAFSWVDGGWQPGRSYEWVRETS